MKINLIQELSFLDGPGYKSSQHGCVYGLVNNVLFYTPEFTDESYSKDFDDWVEVDHLALLGEDEDVRLHVEWVEDMLRREVEGIFADPARMQ